MSYNGPINPNPKDGEAGIVIYGYIPSIALAIVGLATFAIVLGLHVWQIVKWKGTRTFHILLAVGCVSLLVIVLDQRLIQWAVDGGWRLCCAFVF